MNPTHKKLQNKHIVEIAENRNSRYAYAYLFLSFDSQLPKPIDKAPSFTIINPTNIKGSKESKDDANYMIPQFQQDWVGPDF